MKHKIITWLGLLGISVVAILTVLYMVTFVFIAVAAAEDKSCGEPVQLASVAVAVGSGASAAGACTDATSAKVTFNAAKYGQARLGRATATKFYLATRYVVGASNYTITKVTATLYKEGSPTFKMRCMVWSDTTGPIPSAVIGTASTNEIQASGLTTSEAAYDFTGISATVTAGQAIWILVYISTDGTRDDANNVLWGFQNDGGGSVRWMKASADSVTWSDSTGFGGSYNMPGNMIVYGCP